MRHGRLRLTLPAAGDLTGVFLWLTQPGAGKRAGERLSAHARALHELPETAHRWPMHDAERGLRRRSVRGGYVVLFRILAAAPAPSPEDEGTGDVTIEVSRVLGPGQDAAPPGARRGPRGHL